MSETSKWRNSPYMISSVKRVHDTSADVKSMGDFSVILHFQIIFGQRARKEFYLSTSGKVFT